MCEGQNYFEVYFMDIFSNVNTQLKATLIIMKAFETKTTLESGERVGGSCLVVDSTTFLQLFYILQQKMG